MANSNCDRNLLFGILALHNGFISRDALIRAMSAWVAEKETPRGQVLVRQGDLAHDHHFLLEALVKAHLQQHNNDPGQSLAALNTTALVKVLVDHVSDADVVASLTSRATAMEPSSEAPGHDEGVGAPTSSGRRFRIIRPHAEGGIGEVYLAHDVELNREVALKQIKTQYDTDNDSRARFVAEAEITGGLEHPGVVPVYGLGRDEHRRPYYAMRFIRGESFKEAIDLFHQGGGTGADPGGRALGLRRLLGRFVDVCEAIAYAHSRGVVHRDIKPANVMLGKYGETLVVDWGLAKAVGRNEVAAKVHPGELTLRPSAGGSGPQTLPGSALGTPAYMSPEQASGDLDLIGPASDVFSLGATLYTILTGRPPVEGKDVDLLLWAVRRGDFAPPSSIRPGVDRLLEAVCLKAMARHPDERYASAEELAGDIEHWLADEPVSAYPEGPAVRLARWARRHRQAVALAFVLLFVATIASWVGLNIWERQVRQARAHVLGLRQASLADDELGKLHLRTDHFPEAEAVYDRAAQRLSDEPALAELRVRLSSRAGQMHRLAEFHRLAEQGERLAFDAADADAIACLEAALKSVAVFEHDDWWDHLPVDGLEPRQVERLRDETYRQLILLAFIRSKAAVTILSRAKAAPHCREALRVLRPALGFRPDDESARVIQYFCQDALGANPARLSRSEPRSAADYYFAGILHLWIADLPNDPFTKLIIGRARDLSELDSKTPLVTAERYLRTAAGMAPDHFWTNFWLGNALRSSKKLEAAELAFNTCAAIRPDSAYAYIGRSLALRRDAPGVQPADRERLERRIRADLDRALELEPYNDQVHLARFYADAAIEQVASAASEALRFLECGRPVHTLTAWDVLDRRGTLQQLMVALERLRQRHGDRPDLWGALARAHLAFEESGQDQKALQAAERALALRPGDHQATLVQAAVYLRRKEYKKSAQGFKAALAALPADFLANEGLAETLEQDGQAEDALLRHEQALRLARRDWQRREAHQGRARALHRLGRDEDARLAEGAALEAGLAGDDH
jgi:eukaryotic-like serine/threonine-protein kinase